MTDASQARAAAMLLRVLLLVAGYQLLVLLWGGPLTGTPARALAVGGMVSCLLSLELLRRQRLGPAVIVFVVLNLLLATVAYGYWGLHAQMQGQLLQLLPVLLAGALLGRRALWLATAWLCALLVLGSWLDAAASFYLPARVEQALRNLALAAFGVLMAAFVIDQSVSSLRDNLRIARQRGADLARKRDELQLEMQEKERSREQLVHALKIENVGRLASGVAHDFNHLLALILGYAGKGRRSDDPEALKAALLDVAQKLAQAIVRDGEGATKFITIRGEGGKTGEECRQVAYAIAHSPLVKTAFFASDPNLGRILAAVGYAGIEDLDQTGIDLYLDDVHVAAQGGRNPADREEDGQRVMQQSEITVRVLLGRGAAHDTVWTCDLSHEYVTINADYRS